MNLERHIIFTTPNWLNPTRNLSAIPLIDRAVFWTDFFFRRNKSKTARFTIAKLSRTTFVKRILRIYFWRVSFELRQLLLRTIRWNYVCSASFSAYEGPRLTLIVDLKALMSRCERHVLHSWLGHVRLRFLFSFFLFTTSRRLINLFLDYKERIDLSMGFVAIAMMYRKTAWG